MRKLLTNQRGQTGAEYLGALLLVGVIVAAIGSPDVGYRVKTEVQRIVCEIAGQSGCTGAPPVVHDQPTDSGDAPREVRDAHCDNLLPGDIVRGNGDDPSGNAEADQVYENLGLVYDYLVETYGLESFDGDNTLLLATINYCREPGQPFPNAFWNGDQMVFGEGFATALDVTAHELAHAITDDTSDLEYQCQSGALNESFSDIIASNVDTGDWEIGEDLPGGALRDMAHPEDGDPPQPGHTDDYMVLPNTDDGDHGGVHYNSGIPNRAYVLMVNAIGRDAAEQIMFRAFTEGLDDDATFEDLRTAALDVARDMFGEDSDEFDGVDESFAAVGLDGTWVAPEAPGC